jgi:lysophospholipase L1-like esterase
MAKALKRISAACVATSLLASCTTQRQSGAPSFDARASSTAGAGGTGGSATSGSQGNGAGGAADDGGFGGRPPRDATAIGDAAASVTLRDGKLDIMPLGDSITAGDDGGYRNELYRALTADGFRVHFVGTLTDPATLVPEKAHEGHIGFTVAQIDEDVRDWLTSTDPDVVLLMAGTNDVAWTFAETPAEVGARLSSLVDDILAFRANLTLLVATIPPLSPAQVPPKDLERADLANQYNAQIRTRLAGRDRVRIAEINGVVTLDELTDGVHPDQKGEDAIGRRWYETLGPLLPSP